MKYVIIGGRKCGTTSLELFLKMKGYDVVRREQLFTKKDGYKIWKHEYSDREPILILRNPIERAYSDWKYAKQEKRTELNYRDYCELKNYNPSLGELNPLKQSKYYNWFKKWDMKIYIVSLDQMIKTQGFPKLNSIDGKISIKDRKWTKEKLNEM